METGKTILITGCTDAMRWYADKVGQSFSLLGADEHEFRTRQPEGYTNFVRREDAQIIDDEPELPEYRITSERDRDNNVATRLLTGSAVSTVEGISIHAGEYRDGRGGIAFVFSATRPGFQPQEFKGFTWQDAYMKGLAFRNERLGLSS